MFRILRHSRKPLCCLALCSLFTVGQTYGQFTTILNIPPDPDVGGNQSIGSDTQLNLSDGGSIDFSFSAGASDGASIHVEVNISGGSVGTNFVAYDGSTVNISGGSVDVGFIAESGSDVNLFGILFVLDGTDITALLSTSAPFTITGRDVSLGGLLADGSQFSFDLNNTYIPGQDQFQLDALLTVTLVHPGDFNGNGYVNGSDFLKWQRGESPDEFSAADLAAWNANYGTGSAIPKPGDFNGDGTVNGSDFLKWQRGESPYPTSSADLAAWEAKYGTGIAPLSSIAAAVPEPTSLLLVAAAILALSVRSNRV